MMAAVPFAPGRAASCLLMLCCLFIVLKLPILELMVDIPICHKVKSQAGGFTGPCLGFIVPNGPSLRSALLNNFRPYNGEKVIGICFETTSDFVFWSFPRLGSGI